MHARFFPPPPPHTGHVRPWFASVGPQRRCYQARAAVTRRRMAFSERRSRLRSQTEATHSSHCSRWKSTMAARSERRLERAAQLQWPRERNSEGDWSTKKKGAMHIAARCPPPRTLSVHTHRDVLLELYRTSIAPPRPLVHSSIRHHPSPLSHRSLHCYTLLPFRPSASTSQQQPSTTPRPRLDHANRCHTLAQPIAIPKQQQQHRRAESAQSASPPRFHRCPCPAIHIFACNHQPPFPLPPSLHHTQADRPCKWASSTQLSFLPSPPTRTQPS